MSWLVPSFHRRPSSGARPLLPSRAALALLGVWAPTLLAPHAAHADRYEAQWSLRVAGGATQVREAGVARPVAAPRAALALGMAYGVTNWLDLSVELELGATAPIELGAVPVVVDGGPLHLAELTRRQATARISAGPVFRAGVGWVALAGLGLGAGARWRSAGRAAPTGAAATGLGADLGAQLVVAARLGLERRVSRRVTVGFYVSTDAAWAPSLPVALGASTAVGAAFVHYPRW